MFFYGIRFKYFSGFLLEIYQENDILEIYQEILGKFKLRYILLNNYLDFLKVLL